MSQTSVPLAAETLAELAYPPEGKSASSIYGGLLVVLRRAIASASEAGVEAFPARHVAGVAGLAQGASVASAYRSAEAE